MLGRLSVVVLLMASAGFTLSAPSEGAKPKGGWNQFVVHKDQLWVQIGASAGIGDVIKEVDLTTNARVNPNGSWFIPCRMRKRAASGYYECHVPLKVIAIGTWTFTFNILTKTGQFNDVGGNKYLSVRQSGAQVIAQACTPS